MDKLASLAGVVELVDTPDLGSGVARRGGSSPSARTKAWQVSAGWHSDKSRALSGIAA